MTLWTRRGLIGAAGAVAFIAAVPSAWALTPDDAKAHVQRTLEELKSLLRQDGVAVSRAPRLRQIMETRANMPLIAKFAAGRIWREMNDVQQSRYADAFSHYVSITYARRFDEYSGDPIIDVTRARDVGRKGILVESPIKLGNGEPPVAVEWLVSDRAGAVQIVDLVIEGVSMAITLRDELASMFVKRGNDVDALIRDLANAG